MNRPLEGRTALVTGASRGVGRAIAIALAEAGAKVVVNYRERSQAAAEVVGEIERLDAGRSVAGASARALAVQADVTQREQVRTLLSTTLETFGGLDILVNNAGLLQQKPFAEITDEDWDRVLAVNLKGAVHLLAGSARQYARAQARAASSTSPPPAASSVARSLAHYSAARRARSR